VQGFFHYVNADGPYASYKYDGRDTIGELKPDVKENKSSSFKINQLENNQLRPYIIHT